MLTIIKHLPNHRFLVHCDVCNRNYPVKNIKELTSHAKYIPKNSFVYHFVDDVNQLSCIHDTNYFLEKTINKLTNNYITILPDNDPKVLSFKNSKFYHEHFIDNTQNKTKFNFRLYRTQSDSKIYVTRLTNTCLLTRALAYNQTPLTAKAIFIPRYIINDDGTYELLHSSRKIHQIKQKQYYLQHRNDWYTVDVSPKPDSSQKHIIYTTAGKPIEHEPMHKTTKTTHVQSSVKQTTSKPTLTLQQLIDKDWTTIDEHTLISLKDKILISDRNNNNHLSGYQNYLVNIKLN